MLLIKFTLEFKTMTKQCLINLLHNRDRKLPNCHGRHRCKWPISHAKKFYHGILPQLRAEANVAGTTRNRINCKLNINVRNRRLYHKWFTDLTKYVLIIVHVIMKLNSTSTLILRLLIVKVSLGWIYLIWIFYLLIF